MTTMIICGIFNGVLLASLKLFESKEPGRLTTACLSLTAIEYALYHRP